MEMLAWSESKINGQEVGKARQEINFFIGYLSERGWIMPGSRVNNSVLASYKLTVKGYAHLDEFGHKVIISSKAFVAMWFHESMKDVWEKGIKPAIEESGYEPVRIDQKEHSNKIDDEIIAEIRRSRFIVADFTHGNDGARGGVYYEAGFAHGLNIPVIFTCREDVFEKIHSTHASTIILFGRRRRSCGRGSQHVLLLKLETDQILSSNRLEEN